MNIKTVQPNLVIPIDSKQKVDAQTRLQESVERDANGKREQEEKQVPRHLSQQDFDDCIKILEDFAGLKANNLKIRVEQHEDSRVVLIVDQDENIVRRLSESQLWLATRDKDKQTGRILDKAM